MTTTKLRSLIAAATHTSWVMDDDGRGFYAGSLSVEWMALCSAVAEALPALLDIAERVAKSRHFIVQSESDDLQCTACRAFVAMVGCMEYDASMGEEFIHDYSERLWRDNSARIPHEPDCFFVAARKLRGGE